MLGLRFIAVMPRSTSAEKIAQIGFYGGESHFVDSPAEMYAEGARLAAELGGHYMDQFTYAERVTDWRGNNNIAESIFGQMTREEHPVPAWIVVGAGTGGTSATLGRYVRYRRLPTRLCLADPEASVFHRHLADRRIRGSSGPPSVIEGIGRLRCEPSFIPELIDRAYAVPDAASIAAARVLSRRIGRSCGGSTGTDMWAAARIVGEMTARGEQGAVRHCCATRASATAARSSTMPGSRIAASTPGRRRTGWSASSTVVRSTDPSSRPGSSGRARHTCVILTPRPGWRRRHRCGWSAAGRAVAACSRSSCA